VGIVVDTSIFIATQRRRFAWREWAASLTGEPLFLTAITLSELLHGVHRSQTEAHRENQLRLIAWVERDFRILPFGIEEARVHAQLTAELQSTGFSAGASDLLIAAIALRHDFSIATLNLVEFRRIPKVTVLDPSPYLIPR
jgi:tRNA(fMet)-specific endonuclease VapC